jgi:hypothetical protein
MLLFCKYVIMSLPALIARNVQLIGNCERLNVVQCDNVDLQRNEWV